MVEVVVDQDRDQEVAEEEQRVEVSFESRINLIRSTKLTYRMLQVR